MTRSKDVRCAAALWSALLLGSLLVQACTTRAPVRMYDTTQRIRLTADRFRLEYMVDRDRLTYAGPSLGPNLLYIHAGNQWEGPDPSGDYRFFGGLYSWISPQEGPLGWITEDGSRNGWPPDPAMDVGPVRAVGAFRNGFAVEGPITRFGLREHKVFTINDRSSFTVDYSLQNPTSETRTGGTWLNQAVEPGGSIAIRDQPIATIRYAEADQAGRLDETIVERAHGWILIDTARATGGGYKVYIDGPAELAVWKDGYWMHRRMSPEPGQRLADNREGPVALWLDSGTGIFEAELYGPLVDIPPLGSHTSTEQWRIIESSRPSLEVLAREAP